MQVVLPRIVGIAALLVSVRWIPGAVIDYPDFLPWLALCSMWLATAVMLVFVRGVVMNGLLLAVLAGSWGFWPTPDHTYSLALVCWYGLVLASTEGRPDERALLVRILVTVVYAFAALTKLQPSFLAGDQLVRIGDTVPQMSPFADLLGSPAGRWLAATSVLLEAWLAIGLWMRRTRRPTAWLGASAHLVFLAVSANWWWAGVNLLVLNGLLVAGYLAFFHEPDSPDVQDADSEHDAVERSLP